MDKLFSFMLPTRGRSKLYLPRCIESLRRVTNDISKLEFLIRVDEDDEETQKDLDKIFEGIDTNITVGLRGRGYLDIHHYYNQLAKKAVGQFLVIWNDDLLVSTESKNWDVYFEENFKDKYIIAWPYDLRIDDFSYCLPFIHRKFYEIIGKISGYPHSDEWIKALGDISNLIKYGWFKNPSPEFSENVDIFRNFEGMKIRHFLDKLDKTGSEIVYSAPSLEELNILLEDIIKVRTFIRSNQ